MRKQSELDYYYDDSPGIENAVLLPREVMDYLACGRSVFYKLVNSGELHAFRVGKQWRISRESLDSFTQKR